MLEDPLFFDECGVGYGVRNPLGNGREFRALADCVAIEYAEVSQYEYKGFEIVHIRCWDQQRVVGRDSVGVVPRARSGVGHGPRRSLHRFSASRRPLLSAKLLHLISRAC